MIWFSLKILGDSIGFHSYAFYVWLTRLWCWGWCVTPWRPKSVWRPMGMIMDQHLLTYIYWTIIHEMKDGTSQHHSDSAFGFCPKDNPNLQTTSPAWIPKAVLRMELFDQCDSRIFASSAVTIDGSGWRNERNWMNQVRSLSFCDSRSQPDFIQFHMNLLQISISLNECCWRLHLL